MRNLRDYLSDMTELCDQIESSGREIYAFRSGQAMLQEDSGEYLAGESTLFTLPKRKRAVNKSGEVVLNKKVMRELKHSFDSKYIESLEKGNAKIYPFSQPERQENLGLKDLQELCEGSCSTIFCNVDDLD